MGDEINWLPGFGTTNPLHACRIHSIDSVPSIDSFRDEYLGTFSGIQIKVSDLMTGDQIAMMPGGEAVMSHERYAELMKRVVKQVDDRIMGTFTQHNQIMEDMVALDPERAEMESTELWGSF